MVFPLKHGPAVRPNILWRTRSMASSSLQRSESQIKVIKPASSKGCCLNPKVWCTGSPYHPFSIPWKIQEVICTWIHAMEQTQDNVHQQFAHIMLLSDNSQGLYVHRRGWLCESSGVVNCSHRMQIWRCDGLRAHPGSRLEKKLHVRPCRHGMPHGTMENFMKTLKISIPLYKVFELFKCQWPP